MTHLLVVPVLMFLSQPATPPDGDPMQHLRLLSGRWVQEDGAMRSEEHWTDLQGDTLFGIGRTIARGRTVFHEFLRIERRADKSIVYIALLKGQGETAFTLTSSSPTSAVFENAQHDFPKRIAYTRKGDELHITIEGVEKQAPKRVDWVMKRIAE